MWWFSWGWASCFHACGPKNTPVYSFLLYFVTSQQVLLYSLFTVLNDKFTETCTRSFAFSPYSGDQPLPSRTCLCAQTGFVSRAGWDRCELGLDKCILFLQRGRPTFIWLQGMVAPNPNSAVMRGRGRERYVWQWMRGMRRKVVRSRCDPLSSLCLNKSCSRSFYLHMLTGTSELPEETHREKKMEDKKTEEENQKELCPSPLLKA